MKKMIMCGIVVLILVAVLLAGCKKKAESVAAEFEPAPSIVYEAEVEVKIDLSTGEVSSSSAVQVDTSEEDKSDASQVATASSA